MRYALSTPNSFPVLGNSLFDDFFAATKSFVPAVDLVQRESDYLLKMDLPGFDQKDVSIDFEGDVLTVKGQREEVKNSEADRIFCQERSRGSFERSFRFKNVDGDKISASYSSGVLTISLPLREEVKAKKISIAFN